jgi:hypothetical protein
MRAEEYNFLSFQLTKKIFCNIQLSCICQPYTAMLTGIDEEDVKMSKVNSRVVDDTMSNLKC